MPSVRWYVQHAPWDAGKLALLGRFARAKWPFEVTTRGGFRMRGNTTDFVQSTVFFFGEWEPNITAWVRRTLRPGDVFVDVGANVGYYTLLAAELVGPTGAVVAIEASPSIYELLAANVALNPTLSERITCINAAVLDRSCTVTVHHGPDHNFGSTSVVSPAEGSWVEATVPGEPLDRLLGGVDPQRVRIVKIDVEGAEWFVAQGMKEFLAARGPSLEVLLELDPRRVAETGHDPADVLTVFTEAGLRPHRIHNDYEADKLLRPVISSPTVLTDPIVEETDLVLSASSPA